MLWRSIASIFGFDPRVGAWGALEGRILGFGVGNGLWEGFGGENEGGSIQDSELRIQNGEVRGPRSEIGFQRVKMAKNGPEMAEMGFCDRPDLSARRET